MKSMKSTAARKKSSGKILVKSPRQRGVMPPPVRTHKSRKRPARVNDRVED